MQNVTSFSSKQYFPTNDQSYLSVEHDVIAKFGGLFELSRGLGLGKICSKLVVHIWRVLSQARRLLLLRH